MRSPRQGQADMGTFAVIAVGHMESVTLQNATLVEEAISATQALAEQSRSLQQMAHVFIV